jgi:hypothetical protein
MNSGILGIRRTPERNTNSETPMNYPAKLKNAALLIFAVVMLGGCTEEARNKISRTTDNFLGEDLRVSYIDSGQVVKTWTVRDGKITSGKDDSGNATGYYYFWTEETGYVQVPIERTVIEEIKPAR